MSQIEVAQAQATPPVAAPATPPDASAFLITIPHALGVSNLTAQPTRIVLTAAAEELDSLSALGLSPVLTCFLSGCIQGIAPRASAAGAGSLTMAEAWRDAGLDVEQIAAATPDLILTAWIDDATYALLSAISPTIVVKNEAATT